jgi:hypothetical protein
MRLPITLLAAVAALFLSACSPNKQDRPAEGEAPATAEHTFPYPQIPNLLTDPADRRDYLLQHYWDNFDFADTTLVLHNADVTEQGMSNYLSLLNDAETTEASAHTALTAFCTALHGHAEAQQYFVDKFNDYLFDVNSPVYSEATFRRYLEAMLPDTLIDEVHRLRFAPVLELIRRNNPGMRATDFGYTTADGRLHTLLGTPAVNNRLLLIFFDPDCEHCKEELAEMFADEWLARALRDRRLALLAVYTEGDEELWRSSLSQFPAGWQVGNDASTAIRGRLLYDLKAMPSLYLLDGEHTVLLKDAPYDSIKEALSQE